MLVRTPSPTQAGSLRGILQTTRPQPAERARSAGPPTLVWRPHLSTPEFQSRPLASWERRASLMSQRRPAAAASTAPGRPPRFKAWLRFFKYYLGTRNSGWTDRPSVRLPRGKTLLRVEGRQGDAPPAWLSVSASQPGFLPNSAL